MPSDDEIRRIIQDPSVSHWLRNALSSALERDPVDAANDAGLLAVVLDKRASDIVAASLATSSVIAKARSETSKKKPG